VYPTEKISQDRNKSCELLILVSSELFVLCMKGALRAASIIFVQDL
jgi:hypothetical protein